MGRQQREKRKKGKASKKKAKAKDEEIPSTPSGEAALLEPSPPANPAQDSSVDVEDNVTSVITAPTTGIQEGERSPVRMSRRKTRTCKGDLSTNESVPSSDPVQTSAVELEVRTTSPVGSERIEEDDASPSRAMRSVKQSSKGEMPSDEPMLCDDLVSDPVVEEEGKANSSVQTAPTARTQDDSESPVRMTRRVTRSCKVTARINENNNELDGKASEMSSKVQEALVESLQQQLEATVQALQEVSPLKEPLKTPGNNVSPAAVCVESLDHSPSKLSSHSNTASPVVCLERCSESDLLARQRTQSPYEALGLSREEEDLLAAQKPMPLRRKLACVEELPSNEVGKITVRRKSPKISEHLGKRNGCKRKNSPSSIAFKIQSVDEGSCTESASSGSVADVVTGESTSLCAESGPAPSQLGTPALPSARSKRRGVKRSFPGSDSDQVPCRKLPKLDSCDLRNEESMESRSVASDILSHTSDTDLHEQENCCRCDGDTEFSGRSGQCNCRVRSSFSHQSENLETQNETPLRSEYQPGDSRASVSESACARSQSFSDINLSSFEHEDDIHLDLPCDLSFNDSLVLDVMKGVPDDCSSVNTCTRSGNGQEDVCLDVQRDLSLKDSLVSDVMKSVPNDCSSIGQEGDTRDALRDSSLQCSSVCGDMEDIHGTVNISRENDYSHQDDPKDSLLTCSLVPGDMEGVPDDCSHVNTSRRNDFSQEECCQNDREDPGCFRTSVNVPLTPLVQHEEGSQLLGGGTPTKSSRKKSKSSRRRRDNSENSDNDGSRSRTSSRNLVDQRGHQQHQDSDALQDFNGGNTGKDHERSRSASPQNCGQCSRTLPLSKEFSNWKSHRCASSDVKTDLGERTDEHFSKYNDSCTEKQDTLTDVPSSEFSSSIGSESLSSQGSKVHSSPSKHKRSYLEGCVNGKFPSERGSSCSTSPKSAISHHRFEDGREEHEGVSEDHARTERISSKTDDSGSKLNLNPHMRSEIHSSLRHEGNSDGISLENHCISDGNSSRSISLDHSVDNKLQSSNYEEKHIVMNLENHQNEKISQKINRNVSKPLNSDLGSKSNVPPIEHENFYKNKMSAKGDQRKSKLNSKPNSESHIRSHEPSLKLANGFDLALDESSKNSHVKTHSRERKNKKPLLGDNHKTDTEPVKNEKSSSHRHSKSSSERKSEDARNNKRTRDDLKDRIISKKKKLSSVRSAENSLISKDGERIEAYEGKSSVPNEFDKGVCESYKVNDHVGHSKMIDSTKMKYDVRTPSSEKRCNNVSKVIGSSEVGGKDERNKCKRTGKNDAGINTTKQSVSHNVEDTVMNKSDEQPPSTEADTTTAGESSGQSTDARSDIGEEVSLEVILRKLGMKFGKEKLLSIVSSLGDSSSTQGATEGKEAVPCPEEKKQFNECAQKCSPKESGQTHVRNLNNTFEGTDIRPSSVVVPGTKDSDQEGERSEVITDNKQQPADVEVEDTGSSERQNLGLPESYSSARNFVHNQEAESQSDSLSNSIKPLKAVGNCYKEMDDNRKLNSSAASLLKIRSQPISSELVFNNSVDSSSKQSRANEKTSSCNTDLASSPPACVVEAESSPSKQLSPTSPKLQGSPKMRTRSQKAPTPKRASDGYENVLTALHLVKSPRSKDDGNRSVSGLQATETPARSSSSSSENSGSNGNKVHLPESKEMKKVPEVNKVVEKPTTPVRKRLKRNWIAKTTETPPVSQVISVAPSTPPASTTPVPSSCSSLESSPSSRDVRSTPSPNVTTSVEENTSQNETFPLDQPDTSRKSSPSCTVNLPSSECIKKVSPVPVRKGEEFPFKIPTPDKPYKNVPASSKTQEVSPSSLVRTQPRVLNIPKINRRQTSSPSTPNPVIRPLHPRITPPQSKEEDCDDDDAISLFAESADLDIEDMLNSFNPCKRPTPTMSSLSSSCAPRHNFVRRQIIEMPPAEPEPEPAFEPEDMQTEMQEMEFEENNQEEGEEVEEEEEEVEEQEGMEVDTNMVDNYGALEDIEDDRESVLAELQSRHSAKSFMDYLICNNSEEVKLCVDAVTSRPFSAAGQDSRLPAVTPAQATRQSPVRAAPATRVSPVTVAQAAMPSPVRVSPPARVPAVTPAQATRVSTVTPAQATRASPDICRPPLAKHLQTNRPSPIKTVQAARPTATQTSAALSDQSNTLDIGPELKDYHVPKNLKSHEKQRFVKMVNRHCFSFLKNGVCFKKSCVFRHEVPLIEKGDDVLKVVKWSTIRGFLYMSRLYTQLFIQYVCETCRCQGVPLWNGILGCLIHAGKSVEDAINSVITYVFEEDRVEYFAPVLELLVKHKLLLPYRDLLVKVDGIQGFEIPMSVVRYLLTEPKTKQDLCDITLKFIRCESLHRGLWRVERPLIKRYVSGLRSAGFMHLISKFEQVSCMPVLDYNKSRNIVNGRIGLLPTPNQFRPCTEELFKVPSMSVKESLTQAKCNQRSNLLPRKHQLMESSNVRTSVGETSRPRNCKKFGGAITSEFDVSGRNLVTEPEAAKHELPINGLTRLVSPRTLLEDQSCDFSSYPRNVSQMTKGQEVHDHSAGSSSSNKVVLLDRASRVPTLGTPMEQETQLCASPYSPAFSGSSSSQPHFSLSSLSQEGQGSPFSRKSAASESNSSKSTTGRLSPVRLSRDDRRRMEDFEPSRADLQERLPVKSRLGVTNSSPELEESQWNPGSVWEVSPMVVERDVRTRLTGRSRESDIRPEWKLLNMEQDAAPTAGHCSPALVDDSLITLRQVLLNSDMMSALSILRKFCAHDLRLTFARETFQVLKSNVQMASIQFGRLMLQSDREQRSLPLLHLLCTVGVNLMFDQMDNGLVNEAQVIYSLLKDRDVHPAAAKIFQEQMSPCRIMLKCCQICINAKNYHEAKNIVLQNGLEHAKPDMWKVKGIKADSVFRVEVVRNLLAVLAMDGPSVEASHFLIAIIHAQDKKFTPVDYRKYSNTVMLSLLKDGRRAESMELYIEIESERNCLEAPTYRWLLINLEQASMTVLAHRLYGVACLMSVYPLINWSSRPLHVKIFSYWLHEEIMVVIRDFLHQLKQGDQLKPTDDRDNLNLCIYIETQMKPQQSQMKSYPLILSQVKDSIDDAKQRLFGVLRRLGLQATSIPKDRTVQIRPESLAERLKSSI